MVLNIGRYIGNILSGFEVNDTILTFNIAAKIADMVDIGRY